MTSIDLKNLDKAEVLRVLYQNARVNGYCYENGTPQPYYELGYTDDDTLTLFQAREYLEQRGEDLRNCDIRGRWLRVDLSKEQADLNAYGREFGVSGDAILRQLHAQGRRLRLEDWEG